MAGVGMFYAEARIFEAGLAICEEGEGSTGSVSDLMCYYVCFVPFDMISIILGPL